jgi:hypothetical protein
MGPVRKVLEIQVTKDLSLQEALVWLSTWELHGIPPLQTFLPSPTFISTPPIDGTSYS